MLPVSLCRRCAGACLPVYPQTSLFLFGLLAQPVVVSLLFGWLSRIVSFGGLVYVVDISQFVAVVVVVHLLVARCWLRDVQKKFSLYTSEFERM